MGGVPCAWLCLSTEVAIWMCPSYAAEWLFLQLRSLSGARGSILVKGKQAAAHCTSIRHGGLCLIYTLPFRLSPHSATLWRDFPTAAAQPADPASSTAAASGSGVNEWEWGWRQNQRNGEPAECYLTGLLGYLQYTRASPAPVSACLCLPVPAWADKSDGRPATATAYCCLYTS